MSENTFKTLESTCLQFLKDDVDTDQIIPARFLTETSREGFGKKLFFDWRYDDAGNVRSDSPFDGTAYRGQQILVAGHNFGCGSSREHAPWALKDYGLRAILAVSFADIFYNNALKNFLLPVALPESAILALGKAITQYPDYRVTLDLPSQTATLPGIGEFSFDINPFRKTCLLEGLDDVAYVLSHADKIGAYEDKTSAVAV